MAGRVGVRYGVLEVRQPDRTESLRPLSELRLNAVGPSVVDMQLRRVRVIGPPSGDEAPLLIKPAPLSGGYCMLQSMARIASA